MSEPYVRKDPGDIIRAQDWNEAQAQARAQIESHAHTGAPGQGVPLGGDAIARDAALAVRSVAASDALSVKGVEILAEMDRLTAGIGASLPLKGGTLDGELVAAGGLRMADADIRLRGDADAAHGLGWYGPGKRFAGLDLDGPALFGRGGGVLGTTAEEQQRAALAWDGGGNVGVGTGRPAARLQVAGGAIMPQHGAGEDSGILFPPDAFGGSGDRAWMRWHNRRGAERTTLEIGVGNDAEDHIVLLPSGNVGIGVENPQAKLDVAGRLRVRQQEPWTTVPGMQSGWVNYGQGWPGAAFMKDSLGFVRLRGLVKGGMVGVNQTIFVLPAGYRPEVPHLHCINQSGESLGRVDVYQDGRVVPVAGGNIWLCLDGIIFQAAG